MTSIAHMPNRETTPPHPRGLAEPIRLILANQMRDTVLAFGDDELTIEARTVHGTHALTITLDRRGQYEARCSEEVVIQACKRIMREHDLLAVLDGYTGVCYSRGNDDQDGASLFIEASRPDELADAVRLLRDACLGVLAFASGMEAMDFSGHPLPQSETERQLRLSFGALFLARTLKQIEALQLEPAKGDYTLLSEIAVGATSRLADELAQRAAAQAYRECISAHINGLIKGWRRDRAGWDDHSAIDAITAVLEELREMVKGDAGRICAMGCVQAYHRGLASQPARVEPPTRAQLRILRDPELPNPEDSRA